MAKRLVPGLLVFVACAAASDTPRPRPPDLHGALIVSSNYRYYASILYGSGSEARRSALASCKADEPQATCRVYANFKNQCIAVAANGPHHFVATGKEDWDRQRTRDFSLRLCREKSGSECRLLISACSTSAQKVEDQGIKTDSGSPEIEGFQARLSPLVPR